jgi:hypothetical protein
MSPFRLQLSILHSAVLKMDTVYRQLAYYMRISFVIDTRATLHTSKTSGGRRVSGLVF